MAISNYSYCGAVDNDFSLIKIRKMEHQATKKNFNAVLNNVQAAYERAKSQEKSLWVKWLNNALDELRDDDFFGTEGQCDPRGDNRI